MQNNSVQCDCVVHLCYITFFHNNYSHIDGFNAKRDITPVLTDGSMEKKLQ